MSRYIYPFYLASSLSVTQIFLMNQLSTYGNHPKSSLHKYTIPHLLTVAGDATDKSYTSNNILSSYLSFILSLLAKHKVQVSSNTVFIFSIHKESTGPSNTIQSLCNESQFSSSWGVLTDLIIEDAKPSCHSYVNGSTSPYSSPIEIDLGLRTW